MKIMDSHYIVWTCFGYHYVVYFLFSMFGMCNNSKVMLGRPYLDTDLWIISLIKQEPINIMGLTSVHWSLKLISLVFSVMESTLSIQKRQWLFYIPNILWSIKPAIISFGMSNGAYHN